MKTPLIAALSILLCFSSCKKNKSNESGEELPDVELKTRVVASGLSHIWEMVYGPDQQLWITERSGKISKVNPQNGTVTSVYTVPDVIANGEGGLLGMALHPDFNTTPWIYVVYNYGSPYREKVVRFTYEGGTLTAPMVLLDQIPAASIHNGSRLLITSDQKLLISTGDASVGANAQNINSLAGKILRINLDGTVPADNPTAGSRIWSLGHRNVQGLVQANGKIYASEHGANSDDEINLISKGRNYGWPNVQGYCNETNEKTFCAANNVVEPLQTWTPTIATCGLTYYNSDFIPQWQNSLLLVSLKGSRLTQLKLNEAGDQVSGSKDFFLNDFGRLRSICQSPEGKIFMGSSNGNNDKIIEITK